MMIMRTDATLKLLLCLLALAAIFVRALVPAGFMPDFTQAGTPLVICSGVDEKTIYVDETGQPVQKSSHDTSPCTFALNGVATIGAAPAQSFVQLTFEISHANVNERISDSLTILSYQAQGPPDVFI